MRKRFYYITLLYFLLGGAWLILGNHIIKVLDHNTPGKDLMVLSNYKNGIFILMSSIALFFLLKNHQDHLIRTEDNYHRLFEGSPGATYVMDKQSFQLMAVNEVMVQKYGYSREELMQMTALDIRPVEEQDRLAEYLQSDHDEGHETGLWQHQKKNGDRFYVLISHHSIRFRDREAYMVIGIDVDQKIRNEKKLAAIRWHNSHALRKPVSNIKGLLDLINEKEPTDPQIIQMLNSSVNSLEEVIHNINLTNT
nr:PAS domain S-box protein [Pedobacter panaciterrae]